MCGKTWSSRSFPAFIARKCSGERERRAFLGNPKSLPASFLAENAPFSGVWRGNARKTRIRDHFRRSLRGNDRGNGSGEHFWGIRNYCRRVFLRKTPHISGVWRGNARKTRIRDHFRRSLRGNDRGNGNGDHFWGIRNPCRRAFAGAGLKFGHLSPSRRSTRTWLRGRAHRSESSLRWRILERDDRPDVDQGR